MQIIERWREFHRESLIVSPFTIFLREHEYLYLYLSVYKCVSVCNSCTRIASFLYNPVHSLSLFLSLLLFFFFFDSKFPAVFDYFSRQLERLQSTRISRVFVNFHSTTINVHISRSIDSPRRIRKRKRRILLLFNFPILYRRSFHAVLIIIHECFYN